MRRLPRPHDQLDNLLHPRQVVTTGPYSAHGSALTLLDALHHFDAGAGADPNLDALVGTPLGLTAGEKSDLFEFLHSLRSRPILI